MAGKTFSERVAAARTRRPPARSVPENDGDSGSTARAALVDKYLSEPEPPSPASAGGWRSYIPSNPFSVEGLKSDVSDIGSKISGAVAPLGKIVSNPRDAFSSERWKKAGETVAAQRAADDAAFEASKTGQVLGKKGAMGFVKDTATGLADVGMQVGSAGLDVMGHHGKAMMGDPESTAWLAKFGTEFGKGSIQSAKELAKRPWTAVDPGIEESLTKEGLTPLNKAGRTGAAITSFLLPFKGARAAAAAPVKAGVRTAFRVADAVESGLATRAAAKEAAKVSKAIVPGEASVRTTHPSRLLPAVGETGRRPFTAPESGPARAPWQHDTYDVTAEGLDSPHVGSQVSPPPIIPPSRQLPPIGGTSQTTPRTPIKDTFISHPTVGVSAPGQRPLGVVETGPQGLNFNRPGLGDVTAPPSPGLPTMTPEGGFVRNPVKGSTGLAEMVDKYGWEETGRRAQMTVEEVKAQMVVDEAKRLRAQGAKKVPPPVAAPPVGPGAAVAPAPVVEPAPIKVGKGKTKAAQKSSPGEQLPVVPQVEAAPVVPPVTPPAAPPVQAGAPVRQFANSPMATLEALVKRGNKLAAEEIALRKTQGITAPADAPVTKKAPPKATAPKAKNYAKMSDDKVADLAAMDDPGAVAEMNVRRAKFETDLKATQEAQLAKMKAGQTTTMRGETGAAGRDIGDVLRKNEQIERPTLLQEVRDWAERQGQKVDPGLDARVTEMENRQFGVREQWEAYKDSDPDNYGKAIDRIMQTKGVNAQMADNILFREFDIGGSEGVAKKAHWERPPFRKFEDTPDVTEEIFQRNPGYEPGQYGTTERRQMRPSDQWYAGQRDIDRAQVENVKRSGLSNPEGAALEPPYLFVDENGNYQIHDGHHRSTAALEEGKRLEYQVEDVTPKDSPQRISRDMDTAFYEGGEREAGRFKSQLDDITAQTDTGTGSWEASSPETPAGGGSPYRRSILSDETGSVNFKGIAGMGLDVANQVRLASMLSGWALPKSIMGNIGSFGVGAVEDIAAGNYGRAGRGIKEALRLPTNAKEAYKGLFTTNPQFAGTAKSSWINLPGKAMGALDEATTKAHIRAGRSKPEAQRLLLQDPQYGLKGPSNAVMDYLVPFRRTPFNVLQGGGATMGAHPYLSVGAGGLGAAYGSQFDDPRAIGMAAALMGPYTLPFLFGAGATAGPRALQGLSPIPEWSIQKSIGDPLHPFQEPSFNRMFEEPGQQKATPHRGSSRTNPRSQKKKRGGRG